MKHQKLFIVSVILVFILYVVLSFITVFSVSDVKLTFSVYSDEDVSAACEILDSYKGKNLLFIDTGEVASRITEETSLKVEYVRKSYPYTLEAKIFAREERFVIESDGEYYVLDDEYTVLKTRSTPLNPSDGLSDVLLIFETEVQPVLNVKSELGYADEALYAALKTTVACFLSPRDLLESVTLTETEEAGNFRITVKMRTGTEMVIFKATARTEEKVNAGIAKYSALTDGDLLCGRVLCYEEDSGKITATYTRA